MYKYTKQQQQQSSYKLYVHMQKLPSSGGYDVSKHNAEQTCEYHGGIGHVQHGPCQTYKQM